MWSYSPFFMPIHIYLYTYKVNKLSEVASHLFDEVEHLKLCLAIYLSIDIRRKMSARSCRTSTHTHTDTHTRMYTHVLSLTTSYLSTLPISTGV